MLHCIYMHQNQINGKVYIGQTNNLKVRWNPHSYKGSSYFYNAILKYGWDKFSHKIIENNIPSEKIDAREKYWINYYESNNKDKGYNLTSGGTNNYNLSLESKKKIQKSNQLFWKNFFTNPETKELGKEKIENLAKLTRKKVVCLNNNKVFISVLEASKYANLKSASSISRCCSGERKTAGKDPITKERLKWAYYNEEKEKEYGK